jgi:hypothetical protein
VTGLAHRVPGIVGVAALVLGAGCGGSGAREPTGATVPVEEITTTTTTLEQAYAVPAEPAKIDAAYLNRVLGALFHLFGDAQRKKVATGQVLPADLLPVRAISNDPDFETRARLFATTAVGDRGDYREPIGDRRVTVTRVISARPDCVVVEVTFDFSPILVDPPPPTTAYLTLRPTQPGADPANLNPTPWSISNEDTEPEDRCAER